MAVGWGTPRGATAPRGAALSEDALLTTVLDMCKVFGLRVAHFRPARTERGWRTAVQGDGAGFPDLVIVGPGGVLFRELKAGRGRASVDQTAWLAALDTAGQDAAVWRPEDLGSGRIEAELRALRGRQ